MSVSDVIDPKFVVVGKLYLREDVRDILAVTDRKDAENLAAALNQLKAETPSVHVHGGDPEELHAALDTLISAGVTPAAKEAYAVAKRIHPQGDIFTITCAYETFSVEEWLR